MHTSIDATSRYTHLGTATGQGVMPSRMPNKAPTKTRRLAKLWCDSGFKKIFIAHCRQRHVSAEVVNRIHAHAFVVLPQRWIVERTWSWTMNNRRLQIDYERDPKVAEGFIWAAHSRLLLRRLTQSPTP